MIKVTNSKKVVRYKGTLVEIPVRCRYVAADKSGAVHAFAHAPKVSGDYWVSDAPEGELGTKYDTNATMFFEYADEWTQSCELFAENEDCNSALREVSSFSRDPLTINFFGVPVSCPKKTGLLFLCDGIIYADVWEKNPITGADHILVPVGLATPVSASVDDWRIIL